MQKTSYEIINSILRTEKGTNLESDRKYIFSVDINSTKIQIKKAIEEIYKVNVENVNCMIMPCKPKRVRMQLGRTQLRKKAVVTLKKGQKIETT